MTRTHRPDWISHSIVAIKLFVFAMTLSFFAACPLSSAIALGAVAQIEQAQTVDLLDSALQIEAVSATNLLDSTLQTKSTQQASPIVQEPLLNSQTALTLEQGIERIERGGGKVMQVSTGSMHTAAINSDGTLWTWGYNDVGQLGLGDTEMQTSPQQVTGGAESWRSVVAAGDPNAISSYTLAIGTDGSLWAWGRGTYGQLGLGDTASYTTPQRVTGGANTWKSISPGWYFTIGIGEDGSLWTWGRNNNGQLGIGSSGNTNQLTPREVKSGPSSWLMAGAGRYHAIALCSEGKLWTWGGNSNGQLGLGLAMNTQAANMRTVPAQVNTGASSWSSVSAGALYSAAIGDDGNLWVWGAGGEGQLGLGSTASRNAPVQVTSGAGKWQSVSTGSNTTAAIGSDGSLWMWGANRSGQLGQGNRTARNSPVRITTTNTQWHMVSVGMAHTTPTDHTGTSHVAAICTNRDLWTWGWNEYGTLGKGIVSALDSSGTNTDNWRPWRMAGSLMPTGLTNWNPQSSATTPRHQAQNITEVNTPELILRFDRPMCTDAALLGTIEISHGAYVDMSNITEANWSDSDRGPNSVFTAPLVLIESSTLHTAKVSGFVDAQFGNRPTTEMYPHTWTFRTAAVTPPTPDPASLSISQQTLGTFANWGLYFDFNLTLIAPKLYAPFSGYRGYVYEIATDKVVTATANGTIAGTDGRGAYLLFTSDEEQVFALKHGQKLVFPDAHIGTRYLADKKLLPEYRSSAEIATSEQILHTISPVSDLEATHLSAEWQTLEAEHTMANFSSEHIEIPLTGHTAPTVPTVVLVSTSCLSLLLLLGCNNLSADSTDVR